MTPENNIRVGIHNLKRNKFDDLDVEKIKLDFDLDTLEKAVSGVDLLFIF